jgi:predicted alpha/beta-hydrolase family hydrolase
MRDEHLYALKQPMLFISGTKDNFARRDLLENVVGRIRAKATLVWVEGGDHSLKQTRKDSRSLETAAQAIADWVRDILL